MSAGASPPTGRRPGLPSGAPGTLSTCSVNSPDARTVSSGCVQRGGARTAARKSSRAAMAAAARPSRPDRRKQPSQLRRAHRRSRLGQGAHGGHTPRGDRLRRRAVDVRLLTRSDPRAAERWRTCGTPRRPGEPARFDPEPAGRAGLKAESLLARSALGCARAPRGALLSS